MKEVPTSHSFHNLLDISIDPILVINPDWKITDCNDAAENLIKISRENLIGSDFSSHFNKPESAALLQQAIISKGFVKEYQQTVFRHSDEKLREVLINAKAYQNTLGENQGIYVIIHDISELYQSERQLHGVSESIPGVIYQLYVRSNGELGFYYVNERAFNILGIKNDCDDFFIRFIECIDPSDQERFLESINTAFRDLKRWSWEGRFIRPDGEERYIQGVSEPVKIDNEIIFSGVLLDITERKRAEMAVIEQEIKLTQIIEGNPIPQFVIDKDHKVLYWNKVLEQCSGINAEDIIGTNHHSQAFYTEERPCLADLLIDGLMDKIPQYYEGKYSYSKIIDGAVSVVEFFPHFGENGKWLYFTSALIRDRDGKILGAVETLEDITESKEAEKATKLSEQKLIDIINFLPDATFVIDNTGIIIAWNKAMEDMTGVKSQDMIGKPEDENGLIFYGEKRNGLIYLVLKENEELRKKYPTLQIIGDKYIFEDFFGHHICGKEIYLWGIASPLYDSSGNIIGAIESLRDVTSRKKAEEALLNKTTDLEAAYEELTAAEEELRANYEELANSQQELHKTHEQLVKTEKLAVLGKLSGGVGHELRNPLGAIKNAAYFLNMAIEDPDPDVKETLDIINLEVARSEDIISSLLDFARPKVPVRRQINLKKVIEESLARYTVPDNVKIIRNLDNNLPNILADPDKLFQVFCNLITNAYQAMPEGGTLTISSENAGKNEVIVTASDTGTGISEENMKKMFEPLFTTKAKGIGLGLVVSKGIIESHGGQIDLTSIFGKGTKFTIILPVSGELEA